MKASDAVARFLLKHKIHTCFELVGGMITHLLDSFAETGQFNIISMHHEQAAAFAAEGIARYSKGQRIGVAMGTSGPGATNLITGIGSCWFDSIPCLFITGQVNTNEQKGELGIRQQGFQELEIVELTRSITKLSVKIQTADALLPTLHHAISTMLTGRQGPVLVDIPNNLQRVEIDDADVEYWLNKPLATTSAQAPSATVWQQLAALCSNAKRPLICLGGGARWSVLLDDWLSDIQTADIPYIATLMGHEQVKVSPQYFNMIGSYGNREANWAVQHCDLLIVIGARLDVRQTGADTADFARNAKVVQVDIDANQLNNRIKADLSLCCDATTFFKSFKVSANTFPSRDVDWIETLTGIREQSPADEYPELKISPNKLFHALNEAMQGKPVNYVCDVGNHQMWAAQNLRIGSGQSVHYSGGMGAMGFALPVAIGVAIASGEKVIVITGDGSLQINIQELDTIRRLGLDITITVLNNQSLGMVKNFQDMYFNGRNQSTKEGYSAPSFTRISGAYGIQATQANTLDEAVKAFSQIGTRNTPFVLEVMMEDANDCRPRLAFGSKLDQQFPPVDFKLQ